MGKKDYKAEDQFTDLLDEEIQSDEASVLSATSIFPASVKQESDTISNMDELNEALNKTRSEISSEPVTEFSEPMIDGDVLERPPSLGHPSDMTMRVPMADKFREPEPRVKIHNVLNLSDKLKNSNYLEVAQRRVLELEKEVQKLKRDGEQLSSAGQHFKELADSLKSQVRQAESNYQNMQEIAGEEKKILMQSLEAKEIKITALQERILDVEQRRGGQSENIRIRERELENRLEILKSENETMSSSKDEMILEVKKQVSILNSDLEKYKLQNQKITSKLESKQEVLRRTVKALRIALTMLEGSNIEED